CYAYENGSWKELYDLSLSVEERERIKKAIADAVKEIDIGDPRYEALTIDREAQIAYAAIGLQASLEDKKSWDPDQSKRRKLKEAIEKRLPDFEVRIGGMTTIDITKKGVSKAYGVEWFAKRLGVAASEMLFVGDALYEGGNDEVVIPTGIQI